jgi:trimethylamine:corrinoid methyltransferase-like protein
LLDRQTYQGWEAAGKPTAVGSARDIARQTIAEHRCEPIAEDQRTELAAIVTAADKRAGVSE